MITQGHRQVKPGCPEWDGGALSPGLELDVLDGDDVDVEVEVVDGAHDGGVEAVGEGTDHSWMPERGR
jgi:hypothetical protein